MASVIIGRIGRAHGVGGEVALERCSLTVPELERVGEFTWRGPRGDERRLVLEGARAVTGRLLVRFRGVSGRDEAKRLTLGGLYVEPERLPDAGPGQAYAFQLVGLAVETEDGRRLGVLEDIWPTGARPVFVVRGDREWLVPTDEQTLKRVDLERGVITVALPKGLEDL